MNIGKETETIEFKKSTAELKAGLESISSILNKHGSGIIYFGVKDDGEVCGQQIGRETVRDISRDIRNKIRPECEFEVNLKKTGNDKEFIEVTFNGDRQPYSSDGKYFIRFSDQDRQMTSDELERYFKEKIDDYSYWESEETKYSINDVDVELLQKVVNKGYSNKRIPFEFDTSKNVLNKFGLLSKDKFTLTNAGNVLFSKEKPILLKLATYATETKDTFLKLDHYQGNIYECIEKALTYILESIEWKIVLDGSSQRKENPEIPQRALREIVINAFCHAKYAANTSFEISIFKDRVAIYSPGFFPNGFTPEDFAVGHEEPIMLNPKIINVLFKTCEIESFGYGFENTFKICKENNVEYEYENTKSGFRFIFYRPLGQKYVQEMSETERKVYELIKKDNYARASEIAEKLDVSDKTVYRAFKKLKDLEMITRIGDDFSGYWEIKK